MRSLRYIIALLGCCFFTKTLAAQSDSLEVFVSEITEVIGSQVPDSVQFAYCVIKEGVPHYFGFIKENQSMKPIDNKHSVFGVGSLTKVFTGLVLAEKVENSNWNVDSQLVHFFSFPLAAGGDRTLRGLVTHTAGVPRLGDDVAEDITNPYVKSTDEKLTDYLKNRLTVVDTVGYEYSNLGSAMLGYLLEQSEGRSIEQIWQDLVFSPLGMKHSYGDFPSDNSVVVEGRDSIGKPTPYWEMNAYAGAGAILSSVYDLGLWLNHYFQGKDAVYQRSLTALFPVNDYMFLAYAWHGLKRAEGVNWYFHNGGTNGYTATVLMEPKGKDAVIILTNLSAFHAFSPYIDRVAMEIMEQL